MLRSSDGTSARGWAARWQDGRPRCDRSRYPGRVHGWVSSVRTESANRASSRGQPPAPMPCSRGGSRCLAATSPTRITASRSVRALPIDLDRAGRELGCNLTSPSTRSGTCCGIASSPRARTRSRSADVMAELGLCQLRQRKYDEAESLLRECVTIYERVRPGGWKTGWAKSLLGGALLGQEAVRGRRAGSGSRVRSYQARGEESSGPLQAASR